MKLFHSSVEGAQHGDKGLDGFLKFAHDAGASGAQPSNFMLEAPGGGFLTVEDIKGRFEKNELQIDGVSAHCPFWVHTTAWTGSKTIRPFVPEEVCKKSSADIEQWAAVYILKLLELCAELGVKVIPMFWGVAFGWEIATGYPWGFWKGDDYDLIEEGKERFVNKTAQIREHAGNRDIVLAHEIHPGTAAVCARDFLKLVEICDDDLCLTVNADPSHCWEGEDWETRFRLVGERVAGCHMKNHFVKSGMPLRCMESDWRKRPMQFTQLSTGDINLLRYAELMIEIGYVGRYCNLQGTDTAPLVVEAEGAFEELDSISAGGIEFVKKVCCFDIQKSSFEDSMGAD